MLSPEKIAECWNAGILRWKLKGKYKFQYGVYEKLKNSLANPDCSCFVMNIGRQWGKSSVALIYAVEQCLKNPGYVVKFAPSTQKQADLITFGVFKTIFADCPEELKPTTQSTKGLYHFKNGSVIQIGGGDRAHVDNLRGSIPANLLIIDEAAFIDDLDFCLQTLKPMLSTTGGKMIMMSTPPATADHPYIQYARDAMEQGFYVHKTIDDNPTIDPTWKENEIRDHGGRQATSWRREYMAEFVQEEELIIVPEWKPEYIQDTLALRNDNYKYYHRYIGADFGANDFTAILFGYYDYLRGQLIIQDELQFTGNFSAADLCKAIKDKEEELWPKFTSHLSRVGDCSNKVYLQTLSKDHQMYFFPVKKEQGTTLIGIKRGMVQQIRNYIGAGKLIVDPKCEYLIGCLKYGIWDEDRKEFAKSKKYKHYDHLDSLIYMKTILSEGSDPLPKINNINPKKTIIRNPINIKTDSQKFADMFNVPTGPVIPTNEGF